MDKKSIPPWPEPPTLQTERLTLRAVRPDDGDAVVRLFSDEAVTEFLGFDPLQTSDQAAEMIDQWTERFAQGDGLRWAIILKGTNELIGTCGYKRWITDRGCRAELGCDLLRAHWGSGLMTEALHEVIRFGFEDMKLHRIETVAFRGADRSMNLLRNLGFTQEGVLREHGYCKGEFCDDIYFSLLVHEWRDQDEKVGDS